MNGQSRLLLLATLCLLIAAGGPFEPMAQRRTAALADSDLLPAAHSDFLLDGPHLYKVHRRSRDLVIEDLNGNGLLDMAVVSNERSLLEVFYQNEDAEGWEDRFEKETVTLDRIIRGAVARDVNGNGRIDLLMAASPPRLVVMYQDDNGRLQPPQETTLEADRVVAGDLTGNGHDDILVMRERRAKILHGEPRGIELEPAETFYTSGEPSGAPMIIDFDGDGLADIVYLDASDNEKLVVRFQTAERTFPSEVRMRTSALRAVAPLPPWRPGAGATVAAVQNQTRHLVQIGLAPATELEELDRRALPLSLPQTYAFDPERRSSRSRSLDVDIDGDGRLDMVVYSPDLAVMRVFRQTRAGSLKETVSPTLEGITQAISFPPVEDEPTPVIVFSPSERAIGFVRQSGDSGALRFPRLLPVPGHPRAISLLEDGEELILAVAGTTGDDGGMKIAGYPISRDGELGEQRILFPPEGDEEPSLAGLTGGRNPQGMSTVDLNRSGRQDLVVYVEFNPALLLLQQEDGTFRSLEAASGVLQGLLSGASPGMLREARLDGEDGPPVVMALTERFVRAFTVEEDGNVSVEHQFNARNSSSRLVGMTVGSLRGREMPEVVLLDRGNRILTIHGADGDGGYETITHVDLGGRDYLAVRAVDLDGDVTADLVLTGEDRLDVIYGRPAFGALEVRATAAPVDEEGGYGAVYTGELLPGQGHEAMAVEMREHLLELFVPGTDEEDRPALHRFYAFKMFDSDASIARRPNLDAPPEPRELRTADIDGNGRTEVIALTHDNIIIYAQTDEED